MRLDTGQDSPLVVTPRGGEQPVQLREGEFKASLAEMAQEVRPAANPLRHARRLMLDSLWHEEVYLRWTGQRLELDSEGGAAQRAAQECLELTHAYGRWCERQGRPRDCLSLLTDGPLLNGDGRYALAMELALGSVWNETREAFKDMANPEAVRATLVSAMAMYMTLWAMPEPVSKGLAASLTAGLIAYLGVDTVWSLIQGWRLLVAEADRATTFAELREAGERFGRVMGKNSARVFLLLTTAAMGNTAGLAVKGPGLPGAAQAAVLAESQAGFRWVAVGEVNSVAVSAEGAFTIELTPGAVAMTAWTGGPGSPTRSTLEPGQHARESIPARGPGRDFTVAEREAVNELGRKYGCHTCGTRNPGTKSGDFIPDHQPPSQLAPGQPQRLFPHCKACSLRQGGEVNAELRRK
ncbi:putative lipoprotein [Archangium gephyra]|uniref:Lipoprotein n=1 Tax=Archangium gephyra TaxID=48 RepID=A0AAC8QA10_9BACT|nr:putative lipoprotein [Archangium gephyra]